MTQNASLSWSSRTPDRKEQHTNEDPTDEGMSLMDTKTGVPLSLLSRPNLYGVPDQPCGSRQLADQLPADAGKLPTDVGRISEFKLFLN